jgi:hypothetical protein
MTSESPHRLGTEKYHLDKKETRIMVAISDETRYKLDKLRIVRAITLARSCKTP